MIALIARQSKNPLFQDGVASVPQRQCETDRLLAVADTGQPIFIPAVGTGARMVVREVLPGSAVSAVVLAHRAPGTLAEVGSPAFPVPLTGSRFRQSDFFLRHEEFLPSLCQITPKDWACPDKIDSVDPKGVP